MKAIQLVEWEAPPVLVDVPVPEPGPGEVLVRVAAAGLCHSDLHVMEWPAGTLPYELPFTLGHENAGHVERAGAGVGGVGEGDAVLVHGPWGCGACWRCGQGLDNICERTADQAGHGGGLGFDGGLAEFIVVPARQLVPLGDLDPVASAPLSDAGLTPYHAIKQAMPHLVPGAGVVVIGVGGLGHLAVQLLAALTPAHVVAVDPRPEARRLAERAGARAAVPPGDDTAGIVRGELPRGAGASVVLDFVGNDETMAAAAAVAAPGGHVALVGIGGGRFPMAFGSTPFETSVTFPNWGTRSELIEVVALARAGVLDVEIERVGLDDVVDTYGRLGRGEVTGRAVAVPA